MSELIVDFDRACQIIAAMHAAAVGGVTGPKIGVVEDIVELRAAGAAVARITAERLAELIGHDTEAEQALDRWHAIASHGVRSLQAKRHSDGTVSC